MTKKAKPLTLKSLGHLDENGRYRLAHGYSHTRDNYKVVDTHNVIGYYVAGDGVRSNVRIAPIYQADVWTRGKRDGRISSSHEIGAYYNPTLVIDGETVEDDVANAAAHAARQALLAVEIAADVRARRAQASKPRKRAGR